MVGMCAIRTLGFRCQCVLFKLALQFRSVQFSRLAQFQADSVLGSLISQLPLDPAIPLRLYGGKPRPTLGAPLLRTPQVIEHPQDATHEKKLPVRKEVEKGVPQESQQLSE